MSGYRELMQESFLANESFKAEWKKWRTGKLKRAKNSNKKLEPESVTAARNNFFQKNDNLFDSKISPLERRFRESPTDAIDELIEFLVTDITAFRSGYAKEIFLQWLKNTALTPAEVKRFQQTALQICETTSFRREFRRWCRLMTKLADAEFVLELEKLAAGDNRHARLKSRWMLEMIRRQRPVLRKKS